MDKRNVMISLIQPESIPKEVSLSFDCSPGSVCRFDGKLYVQSGPYVLSCDDSNDGNKLIAVFQQGKRIETAGAEYRNDSWFQILKEADRNRIAAVAERNGIDERKKRIVVVFQMKYPGEQDLYGIFSDIAPLEENDRPVYIDRDTMALVMESEFRSEEEIAEYTAAVIDTMASEGFTDLQAGIGTEAGDIFDLRRSYLEALDSLQTGAAHKSKGTLFRYSEQKLERIIDLIPAENRKKITEEYRSKCGTDAFSDEMMETVRVFFDHDLNTTSASKQLFIHRNTLNYRLDKIKRDTGLDLRTFQDAVVFRLISEMIGETQNNE